MKRMIYASDWVCFVGAMFAPAFLMYMAFKLDDSFLSMSCSFFGLCCMLQMDAFKKPVKL